MGGGGGSRFMFGLFPTLTCQGMPRGGPADIGRLWWLGAGTEMKGLVGRVTLAGGCCGLVVRRLGMNIRTAG